MVSYSMADYLFGVLGECEIEFVGLNDSEEMYDDWWRLLWAEEMLDHSGRREFVGVLV